MAFRKGKPAIPRCRFPECDGNGWKDGLCRRCHRDRNFIIFVLKEITQVSEESGTLANGKLISLEHPLAKKMLGRRK